MYNRGRLYSPALHQTPSNEMNKFHDYNESTFAKEFMKSMTNIIYNKNINYNIYKVILYYLMFKSFISVLFCIYIYRYIILDHSYS